MTTFSSSSVFCSAVLTVVIKLVVEDAIAVLDTDVVVRGSAMETVVTTSAPAAGVVLEQLESVGVILLVERPRSRSLVEDGDVLVLNILEDEKLGDVVVERGRNVDDSGVHSFAVSGVTTDVVDDVGNDEMAVFVVC